MHIPGNYFENDSKSLYGQNTQVGYRKPVFLDSFMVFGFCYLQYYSNWKTTEIWSTNRFEMDYTFLTGLGPQKTTGCPLRQTPSDRRRRWRWSESSFQGRNWAGVEKVPWIHQFCFNPFLNASFQNQIKGFRLYWKKCELNIFRSKLSNNSNSKPK